MFMLQKMSTWCECIILPDNNSISSLFLQDIPTMWMIKFDKMQPTWKLVEQFGTLLFQQE